MIACKRSSLLSERVFQSANQLPADWKILSGMALGTPYQIKYYSAEPDDYGLELTLLLNQFSRALSIFDPDSEVSQFNRTGYCRFQSPFFFPVLQASARLVALTDGAFDPTVGALVEAYGFGRAGRRSIAADVVTLQTSVGFQNILFTDKDVKRTHSQTQLTFNAIAKGYAVDVVAAFLEERGHNQYLIELGGEVRCQGSNPQGQPWQIGIIHPAQPNKCYQLIHLTAGCSLATSGTYRNYYNLAGEIRTHLIQPQTGRTTPYTCLSVTVKADDCMTADALATALLLMESGQRIRFMQHHPQFSVFIMDKSGLPVTSEEN